MAVTLVNHGTYYTIDNGVYEADVYLAYFLFQRLERDDSSAFNLLDHSSDVEVGHRYLYYQTELSDHILTAEISPANATWVVSYQAVGSDMEVTGVTNLHDWQGNQIQLTLTYLFIENVDYVRVKISVTNHRRLRWAVFKDSYHLDLVDPQSAFSYLATINDFSSYNYDSEIRAAWHNPRIFLEVTGALPPVSLRMAMRVELTGGEGEIVWHDESGTDWRRDTSHGLTDPTPDGFYFCSNLRHKTGDSGNPVVDLLILVEVLESISGDDDGPWKEVGRLDYPARVADDRWYAHWLPWPSNITLSDIHGLRFTFYSSQDCAVMIDEIRHLKWWIGADLDAAYRLGLGQGRYPDYALLKQTGHNLIFFYDDVVPFDAVAMVGRRESARALAYDYNINEDLAWMQLENVLWRTDEYTLASWWEIWTYHSAADETWDFLQDLLDREEELAGLTVESTSSYAYTNAWPEKLGNMIFEMDGWQEETIDNSLQQREQMQRLNFNNLRQLSPRADSLGFLLSKSRYLGPFATEPFCHLYDYEYFDAAVRYFRSREEKQIWGTLDLSQPYKQLYQSAREEAVNFQGAKVGTPLYVYLSARGKRGYVRKGREEEFDFAASEFDDNGVHYFPEQIVLEAVPSLAALVEDTDLWGYPQHLQGWIENLINDLSWSAYHENSGLIIQLPRYRDYSFSREDLILYDAWRVGEAKSSLLTSGNFTVSDDSYLDSTHPTNHYEWSSVISVGYGADATEPYHGIVKVDLSSLPAYDQTTVATLYLYCNSVSGGALDVEVWGVAEDWTPTQATWNEKSSGNAWAILGGTPGMPINHVHIDSGDLNSWISVDITPWVRAIQQGDITNYGILLIPCYVADSGYPAFYTFESLEDGSGHEAYITVQHGDFVKINNALAVSAANPYIRDEADLWTWRNETLQDLLTAWRAVATIVPITLSDQFSEVDINITSYGNTPWNGVVMDYTRTDTTGYTRTVGVPNSLEKYGLQWGLSQDDISDTAYWALALDPALGRYGVGRFTEVITLLQAAGTTWTENMVIAAGVWDTTRTLRPRDLEELIRASRREGWRWLALGRERITLREGETPYGVSTGQAQNDLGNSWEHPLWVPPEAYNIQMSPEAEQSTALDLSHHIIVPTRDEGRRFSLITVRMNWSPLNLVEMGLLQHMLQFGRVLQWDLEGKWDLRSCAWETALRFETSDSAYRFYGSHRSWRAGTVRVKIDGTEIYANDNSYPWSCHYEEGYVEFLDTVPSSYNVVELFYQCRLTMFLQSLIPADNNELYREVKFAPVEATFREVR